MKITIKQFFDFINQNHGKRFLTIGAKRKTTGRKHKFVVRKHGTCVMFIPTGKVGRRLHKGSIQNYLDIFNTTHSLTTTDYQQNMRNASYVLSIISEIYESGRKRGMNSKATNISGNGADDDSIDDLNSTASDLGSDDPQRYNRLSSGVKRDPAVRKSVLKRSNRVCERSGCGASRSFRGFIDAHHILGAGKSDRVWNCVALCPNCHREAHFAPERDRINAELLEFAQRFKPE